ncbi:MAG: hypothetical protein ACO1NW_12965 [Chitinophagaceae bacterium]
MNNKLYRQTIVSLSCLLLFSNITAQKKVLGIEIGAHKSIGTNIQGRHYFNTQNMTYIYLSRAKFQNIYYSILPSLSFKVPNTFFFVGIQSGVQAHFNEKFLGYEKPIFVSVPLMATVKMEIARIKSNYVGANISGGWHFFNTGTYPVRQKNGELFNASAYYQIKERCSFKIGIQKQIDNSTIISPATNTNEQDEFFHYNLKRLSLFIAYAKILK